MKKIISCALVTIVILLLPPLVYSADKQPVNDDTKSYMYYWKKGNSGEKISSQEFNILMSELQKRLEKLESASSQTSIGDAGFSYKIGKRWEIELSNFHENIKKALKYVNAVRGKPDSMTMSLVLYVILNDIKTTAYDLGRITQFEKTLNMTHYDLNFWCIAFQKAYLNPLAIKKDALDEQN